MEPLIYFSKSFVSNMSIDLCRADVAMAQHHLYGSQISSILKQVGCKAMSKNVWRDMSDACLFSVCNNQSPECLPRHRLPLLIYEERWCGLQRAQDLCAN